MAYSEASKNATLKYRERKKIVKLVIDMPEEKREVYKAQAAKHGKSLAAYVIGLIEEDMQKDAREG